MNKYEDARQRFDEFQKDIERNKTMYIKLQIIRKLR